MKTKEEVQRRAADVKLLEPHGRCDRKSAAGDVHQSEGEDISELV